MFLSADDLKKCVDQGEIVIAPFNSQNLKGASYTFTLSARVRTPKKKAFIDARQKPEFDETAMDERGHEISPGGFAVFYTLEKVRLNGKYVCLLSTRATLAQLGLDVTQGSFLCEPDTDNPFALEITNRGPSPVRLYPRIKIAKGIFVKI